MFRKKEEKGICCWVCGRKTPFEHQSMTPEEVSGAFAQVFEGSEPYEDVSKFCLCSVCISLIKYVGSDSFKTKKKLEAATEKLKRGASSLGRFIKEKTGELKEKAAEIRENKD